MMAWFRKLAVCIMFYAAASLAPALAQESGEPIVEVELSESEVIPGQPTVLRMTVLVPTWLPKPVVFPTFEVPDLMVKLPERATSPVSRTIEGETWSGVSRAYRLSPMVPGSIAIPAQELTITWAEPGKPDPMVMKTSIDSMTVTGVVPDGAEELDPFIAATSLTLTEELSTEERVLKPGDSLTRQVILEIGGTSPLFVPSLLPRHEIQGVASYPAEPDVTETTDRTWVSGKRTESVTLVAESGGSGSVPAIEVNWYNLETNSVETARVDGFELSVDAPVARQRPEIDPRLLLGIGLLGICIVFVVTRLSRWFFPKVRDWNQSRIRARVATENWAYTQLQRAVRDKDYGALMPALSMWQERLPDMRVGGDPALEVSLTNLGRDLYGPVHEHREAAWSDLSKALAAYRARVKNHQKRHHEGYALAPINPK